MSAIPEQREPKVLGMKPAKNVVFRVYSPPRPLGGTPGDWATVSTWRDFQIQKVDFQVDGTMVLHSLVLVNSSPDLRPEARLGDKIESWMELIAAVIAPNGHLRAESIVLAPEPSEPGDKAVN